MTATLAELEVRDPADLGRARQLAVAVADRLGFDQRAGLALASAVDALLAGGRRVAFRLEGDPPTALGIRVDLGPTPGPGRALDAARPMVGDLRWDPSAGDGAIIMSKALPQPVSIAEAGRIASDLLGLEFAPAAEESPRRDLELLEALHQLDARDRELAQTRLELEETNRGVMALYVELDERADSLRLASELKTRFLANVSHELRTPLSSILSLARLLLDRADGELSEEQDRQVGFILRSAHDLAGMVNDLLDLARIEADCEPVHPEPVDLAEVFKALRGMLRPLVPPDSPVRLVIDDPEGLPPIVSDEAKLSQVLHNFLSNALKFTERGEVRLVAQPGPGETVVFSVSDTGIGIREEHLARIFEEFGQVDSPIQRRVKGTGLGLPLARKLARLLGGDVAVRSEPGVGSTFSATIPLHFPGRAPEEAP